jgi:hypothetical protein
LHGLAQCLATRGRGMSEDEKLDIVRLQEQLKAHEAATEKALAALGSKMDGIMQKAWAVLSVGLGYVVLKLLEMIGAK